MNSVVLGERLRRLSEPVSLQSYERPMRRQATRAEAVLDLAFTVRLMKITRAPVDLLTPPWGNGGTDD